MESRILDTDPATGITRVFHYDHASDRFTIETRQNVTDVVEQNKLVANSERQDYRKGDLHRVASIPLSVYYDLKKRGILDDQAAMRRWLNDRDNRVFRVKGGTV